MALPQIDTPPPPGPADQVATLVTARPRDDQIRLLCDTRPLHRLLTHLTKGDRRPRSAAGRYRHAGEEVVILGTLAGRPSGVRAAASFRVGAEMTALAGDAHQLLTAPPDDPGSRRDRLATLFGRFLWIHPYSDGNGRIARILFQRGCALLDLPLGPAWQLDHRCYGRGLGLAAECTPKSPGPIIAYMARYFV